MAAPHGNWHGLPRLSDGGGGGWCHELPAMTTSPTPAVSTKIPGAFPLHPPLTAQLSSPLPRPGASQPRPLYLVSHSFDSNSGVIPEQRPRATANLSLHFLVAP